MKAVVQRVRNASVSVDGTVTGSIEAGLLVYLGVQQGDEQKDLDYLVQKIPRLRIFRDSEEKMNLSVIDAKGSMLIVSQFTLCADLSKGNRPSFNPAADPETAQKMYELFISRIRELGIPVASGIFGAHMHVVYENDGPVTIIYDTKNAKNA
ncbi:MAG: D-aminoacyl-tRNA deacylase [Sphaerochaetaceae bacterium]|nr:D-aminoacyl-tRNA deacylase [Sphaerochaetaceae bacterium]MDD4396794.1 D-aminoacyl-tRNA deacylase [Sphaerochaetaceae bacterium]